jgi:diguanylate cyclase (GGDEF)-like protein
MSEKARILVVDDEATVRSVLLQVLKEDGYDVTPAENGSQALEILRNNSFDLIITDIKMPGISGLELLKKVKQAQPDTQVIIITSYASLDTSLTALRHGAYDYLFKPFEDLDLISAAAKRATEKVLLVKENRRLLGQLQKQNQQLEKVNRTLKNLACRDGLTGLYNHRYFQDVLTHEIYRAERNETIFSLIFLDVDHFKKYNDTHGHLAGDKLLRKLSDIFTRGVRKSDIVARYGGEEFVIILPSTSKKNAQIVAEKLRRYIEAFPFEGRETQPTGKLTISLGIAAYPDDGQQRTLLIQRADEAMYRAKNGGRNRVCVATVAAAVSN